MLVNLRYCFEHQNNYNNCKQNQLIMNKKIITICGSMFFMDRYRELQKELESKGFQVEIPREGTPEQEEDITYIRATGFDYLTNVIPKSDAVLIANFEKNGVAGYIGTSVIMEITSAWMNKKPIFLLFEPCSKQKCIDEINIVEPTILDGSLEMLFYCYQDSITESMTHHPLILF